MGAMPCVRIDVDNAQDERLDPFRDVRDRDLRGRDRLFMAESEMVVRRLLSGGYDLHALFVAPAMYERLAGDLSATTRDVPVFVAPLDVMTSVAGFRIHRGVLAAGVRPHRRDLTIAARLSHLRDRDRLCVAFAERITNVDNIGALFRNAAAFGADAVVLDPECCDPLYRKAIRVSMGHVFGVPWAVAAEWPEDLAALRATLGLHLIAAESCPGARPLASLDVPPRVGLIFGSEADGIRASTLAVCDTVAEIPMAPGVPSLNVAVTSAVFLHECRGRGIRT
jgi:tRNA G18 (ribose-2'-O)-methylase SpoU